MSRGEWTRVLLATAALTLLWTAPFFPHLGSQIPDPAPGETMNSADARIVVWAMAWEAHALWTNPASFFDANVFYPARGTLTGSDTFLSPALLAAPIFLATGNAILGANLLTMLSYGLCFLLTYVVVRRCGLDPIPCAIAGISVALGPFRLPADVHTLQYSSAFLVLVLAACQQISGRGGGLRLAIAVVLGMFSSFYCAVMVAVIVGIEVVLALAAANRLRAGRIVAATVPGTLLLAFLARPWLARAGDPGTEPRDLLASFEVVGQLFQQFYLQPSNRIVGMGWAVAILALIGLIAPVLRRAVPGENWWRFVLLVTAGALLAVGPSITIGDVRIPMPYELLLQTPARALRAFPRFIILAHIGLAGLAAYGAAFCLDACRARASNERIYITTAVVLVLATLVPRSIEVAKTTFDRTPIGDFAREFYDYLEEAEPGPLLEIPAPWMAYALKRKIIQADFMIESTRHWRPLLNGHTGYPPWWWQEWLGREIHLIPEDHGALSSVVDATGVRWILVHRAASGQIDWERWRGARAHPDLEVVKESDDNLLFRVAATPKRPWLERLRAGASPAGETLLGAQRAPLASEDAKGTLQLVEVATTLEPDQRLSVHFTARNDGRAPWPALAPKLTDDAGLVMVEGVWADSSGNIQPVRTRSRLLRDVWPGETQHNWLDLTSPTTEGDWTLVLSLRQVGVGPLDRVEPLSIPVTVARP